MKQLYLFEIVLTFLSISAFAQEGRLDIVNNNEPIEGVNVLVNGIGYAATDTSGTVFLKNLVDGDEIILSHILFETKKLYWPFRDTCITLHSGVFLLDTAMARAKDDRNFLQSTLKHGLRNGETAHYVRFSSFDTLYGIVHNIEFDRSLAISMKGKALFFSRYMIPAIHTSSFNTEYELPEKQINNYIKWATKEKIPHDTGNGQWYSECVLGHKLPDNLYVEYMGILDDEHVFKFYLTPDRKGKQKGYLFIGVKDEIIHRVTVSATFLKTGNYDLDIRFYYCESQNSIFPSEVHHRSYYCDSNHNMVGQRMSYIIYEWEYNQE